MENGVEVRARCTVCEITSGPDGRIESVRYFDAEGEEHIQRAKAVIVACNGVGTPRLLLHSRSKAHPRGLANSSGLVGKNLMFHAYSRVTGLFREGNPIMYRGALANILWSHEFYETDESRGFLRGYIMQMSRSTGPVLTALGTGKWGADHHRDFAERFGRMTDLGIIGEDLPAEGNCVTLDPQRRDRYGIPIPRIRYVLEENTRKLIAHGLMQARRVLEEAGAHRVIENRHVANAGFHLMGTARMGEDPVRSVVNQYGQAHDADNLFVIDGSVFVTSGGVNPTPTIQAVALRAAEYICDQRRDLR